MMLLIHILEGQCFVLRTATLYNAINKLVAVAFVLVIYGKYKSNMHNNATVCYEQQYSGRHPMAG